MKNKYERALDLKDKEFKLLMGVTKETSKEMIQILQEAYDKKHAKGGRLPKLTIPEQLTLALEYWRQYPTMFELSFEYGIAKSVVHDIITWVEDTLIKDGKFSLPGKKALLEEDEIEIVLVDVMEQPIERPKKNKSHGIQGKRKSIQ